MINYLSIWILLNFNFKLNISQNMLGAYKKAVAAFEEAYNQEPNMTTCAGTYACLLAQLDNEQELEKFCEHLSEDNQVESYIAHCYLALMKVISLGGFSYDSSAFRDNIPGIPDISNL